MTGSALLSGLLLLGAVAGIALGTLGATRLTAAGAGGARSVRSSVALVAGGYGGAVLLVGALLVLALTHLTMHVIVVKVPQ